MIQEIDLKDWVKTKQPMKLYEAPRNSIVSTDSNPDAPFYFHHIDGAYSLCHELGNIEDVFHIAAWTDVFLWKKK